MRAVPKTWGREEIFVEAPYCVKKLVYEYEGLASSLHYHERKHETFTVLQGRFEIYTRRKLKKDAELMTRRFLFPGDVLEIPPGTEHQLRWLGESRMGVVIECSTADDPEDCVRLTPSEQV